MKHSLVYTVKTKTNLLLFKRLLFNESKSFHLNVFNCLSKRLHLPATAPIIRSTLVVNKQLRKKSHTKSFFFNFFGKLKIEKNRDIYKVMFDNFLNVPIHKSRKAGQKTETADGQVFSEVIQLLVLNERSGIHLIRIL